VNKEQTELLLQILDNQIGDYDKEIAYLEKTRGFSVPGSMQIKDRKARRFKIKEIRLAVVKLEADTRLKQAEAQLIGYCMAERADTLEELVTAMNLTMEEYHQLQKTIPDIIYFIENKHDAISTIIENWAQFNN